MAVRQKHQIKPKLESAADDELVDRNAEGSSGLIKCVGRRKLWSQSID
jgi:hypothetical protein